MHENGGDNVSSKSYPEIFPVAFTHAEFPSSSNVFVSSLFAII